MRGEPLLVRLANAIAVVGLTALLAVTALVLLDVLLRSSAVLALRDSWPHLDMWLLEHGFDGLSDLYAPLGIVAVAACFPAMLVTRSAITVRFLTQTFPWRFREAFEAVGAAALLAMFGLMAWWTSEYALDLWHSGETTWLLEIPRWPAFAITCVCLWLGVVIQTVVALRQVAVVFAKVEPPTLPPSVSEIE